jgi:hypothetical protein
MKIERLALPALILALLASPASATDVEPAMATLNGYYEYRGEMIITAIAPATATTCQNNGYGVGNIFTTRFLPPSLGNNDDKWRLSVFTLSYGQHFQFYAGNYPNATSKNVDFAVSMGRGAGTFVVTPKMSITKMFPTSFSTNNSFVFLEGTIRNFGSVSATTLAAGCDVSFRLVGALKP